MSNKYVCTKYASFLLRVSHTRSLETEPAPDWETEIEVEHIQSGQQWTCSSWPELLDFLTQEEESLESTIWKETYPED